MIQGLSHITFIVKDLQKTRRLLKEILDAEEVYSSGEDTHSLSPEMFFLVGGIWVAIMEGDPLAEQTYNHVAFKIPPSEYAVYHERIKNAGLLFREARSRIDGEGQSLYFYDYDNHLFELHTGTLSDRLNVYKAYEAQRA